ncbi:MAG: chemotaxis protein CheW [Denitrovibrio sp.]|nr:MAG: chemotaxis protein CheW [Denitrovibrio sp.]
MSNEDKKDLSASFQVLTFELDKDIFGVDITSIREVLDFTNLTRVPQTPSYMKGVINLRGGVVPVIDLKEKFSMGTTVKTVNTCIIILEVDIGEEVVVLGALADSVDEVVDFSSDNVEPAPKIGTNLKTEFIKGMAKRNDDFVIILNVNSVFSDEDIKDVNHEISKTPKE